MTTTYATIADIPPSTVVKALPLGPTFAWHNDAWMEWDTYSETLIPASRSFDDERGPFLHIWDMNEADA